MPLTSGPSPFASRALAATGAVLAATAVALSAYASHTAQGPAREQLFIAATFAFGHGIALAALAPGRRRRWGTVALTLLLLGVLLFCAGVVVHALTGHSLGVAPWGGALMMLSWLLYAADALRR